MQFWHFDWDEHNIDHVAEHGVDPDEVEQALVGRPLIRRGKHGRYLAFGRSEAGRYLFVVLEDMGEHWARVVTARDMTMAEKRYYRRRGK